MSNLRSLRLATMTAAIAAISAGSALAVTAVVDFTGVSYTKAPGAYTLINASADATVYAFGVTNPTSTAAYVDALDGPSGPYDDAGFLDVAPGVSPERELWGAVLLTEADWSVYKPLEFYVTLDMTMEDLFGTWAYGGDVVNWYEVYDASGIGPGETATQFNFDGPVASLGFVIGVNSLGAEGAAILGAPGADVPLPTAAWMFLAGVGALAGVGRARRRA